MHVDLSGILIEGAVRGEGAEEAAVSARIRARADSEQGPVGHALDRRQRSQGFEIRLALRAQLAVRGQVARQHLQRSTRLARGNLEDRHLNQVVADHIDEVPPAHDAGGGSHVRGDAIVRAVA